jgi:hypothetical protein
LEPSDCRLEVKRGDAKGEEVDATDKLVAVAANAGLMQTAPIRRADRAALSGFISILYCT